MLLDSKPAHGHGPGDSIRVFGRYVGIPLRLRTSERGHSSDYPCLSVVVPLKTCLFGEDQQDLYDFKASTDIGL